MPELNVHNFTGRTAQDFNKFTAVNDPKKNLMLLFVSEICPRFENSYISEPEKNESLRKSIQKNGLIQPISVISIQTYFQSRLYGPTDKRYKEKVAPEKYAEASEKWIEYINSLHPDDDVAIGVGNSDNKEEDKFEKLRKRNEERNKQRNARIPERENEKKSNQNTIKASELQKNLKENEKEIRYLLEQLKRGIAYFITSGHRRFKAYISIFLQKPINTDGEWNELYEELKKKCSSNVNTGWDKIPAIIEYDNKKENDIYNDSNTTQRELTSFEIVSNTIYEMKKNGELKKIYDAAKEEIIENLSERSVNNIRRKIKMTDAYREIYLASENDRTALKGLPYDFFPSGIEGIVSRGISDYIEKNKGRTIKYQTVNNARRILDGLDDKFLNLIYDGKLTIREAKALVKPLKKCDENQKIQIYELIISGNKDFTTFFPAGKNIAKNTNKNDITSANGAVDILKKSISNIEKIEITDVSDQEKAELDKLTSQLKELLINLEKKLYD